MEKDLYGDLLTEEEFLKNVKKKLDKNKEKSNDKNKKEIEKDTGRVTKNELFDLDDFGTIEREAVETKDNESEKTINKKENKNEESLDDFILKSLEKETIQELKEYIEELNGKLSFKAVMAVLKEKGQMKIIRISDSYEAYKNDLPIEYFVISHISFEDTLDLGMESFEKDSDRYKQIVRKGVCIPKLTQDDVDTKLPGGTMQILVQAILAISKIGTKYKEITISRDEIL